MPYDVLILGAGVAGLTAAARLAARSFKVLVVDRDFFPGGLAARLACKAVAACARCNACLLEETLADLPGSDLALEFQTRVVNSRAEDRGFRIELLGEPMYLDPERCVDCDACYAACPARDRAIRRAPAPQLAPRYALDPAACRHFQGRECDACVLECPAGAIDLAAPPRRREVHTRAVIVASGATVFDARLKSRYGYGRLADVITGRDLEAMLRETGRVLRPSDGRPPDRVAFIQCVGSRDKSIGRDYCSRICCGYALRLANRLQYRWPETRISFFHMDIQTFGRNFTGLMAETAERVELIHGVPGEITAGEAGALKIPYLNEATGKVESRDFDLAVLSVGLGPPDDGLDQIFQLARDEDGFYLARPEEGLFVAGCAGGPLDVAESRTRAEGAAVEAAAFLTGP